MRIVALVRRELRLQDNPLWQYANGTNEVIPVFALDDFNLKEHGENLKALFFFALSQLRRQIEQRGGKVYCIKLPQLEALIAIAKPDLVLFCEDYEPHSRERDNAITQLLNRLNIRYRSLRDNNLTPMPSKPFANFARFYRLHFRPSLAIDPPATYPLPKNFRTPRIDIEEVPLPCYSNEVAKLWCMTEEEVLKRWQKFVSSGLPEYERKRDFLIEGYTSRMSPYIRCGMISLRQMWRDAQGISEAFIRELAWRDFFAHLIYFYPETAEKEWHQSWRGFPWKHDVSDFERWCAGETGIPLVDAGMRQLNQEGWMPNRVRMVAASFLTKYLLIDWRWGERHFYQNLADADLAQNVGNWQWVASCGADAVPYFRFFNPILQARKFDIDGNYIRRYVLELKNVPTRYLGDLWRLREVAPNYPTPIVDLRAGRNRFQEKAKQHFRSKR
ncbi:MAG: cryptochrome/photolyase family protein [Candidatus Fervidibacter sp.]|uniref:cryptochrome/photolyase family protein n=1 Tax=Candidatus Fervidibacter sp. TaxID=3100871 RepID=UPI00404ACBD2